jgi:hypothetical protein
LHCDNGRTLGFRGNTHVKYADVVWGGESMTLVVRSPGGRRYAIEDLMLIFTSVGRSFPMKSIPDNISDRSKVVDGSNPLSTLFWRISCILEWCILYIVAQKWFGVIIALATTTHHNLAQL